MHNVFYMVILAIFACIFFLFCRLEWRKYKREKKELADSFQKSEADFLKHQGTANVDVAHVSKEMYQRLKKQQLDQKIRDEYYKNKDADS